MTLLALEINAARIAVGRVNPSKGIEDLQTAPTPEQGVWDTCRTLMAKVAGGEDVTRIGICCAGPIDMAANIVAPAGIPEWMIGFDIGKAAKEAYPNVETILAFDGVCLALAEQRMGPARQVPDALVVGVAEQITGGVMVGGFVAVGRTGNAGHIGHFVVPGSDEPCTCGGRGCLETVASSTATLRWARSQGWTGDTITALADSARAGDVTAVNALRRTGTALGQAISSAAALMDVDLVVVSGELAESGPPFWDPLNRAIATHARLSFLYGLRVIPSQLGDTAALNGAAILSLPPKEGDPDA